MARASELFGANDDFTIPADASHASGTGWLIDPVLNTNGVIVYLLSARASATSTEAWVGSDKGDYLNNTRLWGDCDGAGMVSNLKLAPGLGLYLTDVNANALFKYL